MKTIIFIILTILSLELVSSHKMSHINNHNEMVACKKLDFLWDKDKVIDRSHFSGNRKDPVKFSEDSKTITRVERYIGDDFPAVRVLGDTPIEFTRQYNCLSFEIMVNENHGFLEVGLQSFDSSNNTQSGGRAYFIKTSQNQQFQIESEGKVDTIDVGELIWVKGDRIKVYVKQEQDSPSSTESGINYVNLSFYKNGEFIATPFKKIQVKIGTDSLFPMAGVTDHDDSVTIV